MPEPATPKSKRPGAAPASSHRHIAAIISASSRVGSDELEASLTHGANEDVDLDIYATKSSLEATLAANRAAQSAAIVVAVGGDGTVSDVATGIFGSDAALGIVPAGSTISRLDRLEFPPNQRRPSLC